MRVRVWIRAREGSVMMGASRAILGVLLIARAAASTPDVLVGAHYFGGWYSCDGATPGTPCDSHWKGYSPKGTPMADWRPAYPGRIPLLGNSSTDEATIVNEIQAADRYGLDYFDVLWYDGGASARTGLAACGNAARHDFRFCSSLLADAQLFTAWAGVSFSHIAIP